MKIVVAVKRVVDPHIKVRPTADGLHVDLVGVKMGINPFDEVALEEALRLKESGVATEIVAVTIGSPQHQDVLRHALAMGADRAILIACEGAESLAIAHILKALSEREQPRLIMLGKQAIDDDAAEVGQMLAALLGVGQGTFASKLAVSGEHLTVTREIDGGRETLSLRLPAVVTADLRLNEPRYLKLPNLMQAKKKPIETIHPAELGVAPQRLQPRLKLLHVAEPPVRTPGIRVTSAAELIDKLRHEARVLS